MGRQPAVRTYWSLAKTTDPRYSAAHFFCREFNWPACNNRLTPRSGARRRPGSPPDNACRTCLRAWRNGWCAP